MPFCYIIYSPSIDRFYTGMTSTNPIDRLDKHNSNFYGCNSYTSIASDWKIFLTLPAQSISHARRIEQHIKRMKSRVYIRNLAKFPEMRFGNWEKKKGGFSKTTATNNDYSKYG
ncbi:GIY-YIG nuclease family protein [bacterium SCSIO 12741]|nr:GIY-YIG nuclease family protein [bacterium SCSIO 12741]